MQEETKVISYIISHIQQVQVYLMQLAGELTKRAAAHDKSKFSEDEMSCFLLINRIVREYGYGSPEYKQSLEDSKEQLALHYQRNSHHPEHYPNGIADMSLIDIIEMVVDWKTANLSGKLSWDEALQKQVERFKITAEQLYLINLVVRELNNP